MGFIQREDGALFDDFFVGPILLGIPLFVVLCPIHGGIDVFGHFLAGEIKQQEEQHPPEVDGRNR